jgi:phospholipid/cholesterol/gamma-HCH transport system substrate-binding protein
VTERARAAQVGVLFVASVAVLVIGVLWFKEFRIGGSTYRIHVEFPSTSGLVKGDPVEVKGVPAGSVERIFYEEGRAVVTVQLKRHVVLPRGTTATIENVGLMGQKVVAFMPGPRGNPPLAADTMIRGQTQAGVPELMVGLGHMLGTFEQLALRIDTLLVSFDQDKRRNLALTLEHTERATRVLAEVLEAHDRELGRSITDLGAVMAELQVALTGRGETLGGAIDDAAAAAARMDSTLVAVERAATRLDGILGDLEQSEGTAGKLLRDEALYDEMVVTLRDARALLEDVKANPKKYFKFSIF